MVLQRTRQAGHEGLNPSRRAHARTDDATNLTQAFVLDQHGWLKDHPAVAHAPSPNYDTRPAGQAVHLLVVHNISLPPGVFGGPHIIDFFQNRLDLNSHPWLPRLKGLQVSAHFLIRRTGEVVQFVATDHRAWHAGVSQFQGRDRCNDFSIGIELEGTDTLAYEPQQYHALALLDRAVRARHPIRAVRGHEHIAPKRKTDPGPAFNWRLFARDTGWPLRCLPPV